MEQPATAESTTYGFFIRELEMTVAAKIFVTTFILSILATPALAQLCTGTPLNRGQTALGLGVSFPESAVGYGIRGIRQVTDKVAVEATYALVSYDSNFLDGADVPTEHDFGANIAYEIRMWTESSALDLAICPVAGFGYVVLDPIHILSIPLGLGIGTLIPVTNTSVSLNPYLVPQWGWTRLSIDGLGSTSDTGIGISGGANLLFNDIFAGLQFSKPENGEAVFGIQAGLVF
ncbi:MAG: hypothetical protein LBG44_02715 [Gemmatimonadota bacterium]|nr:hypothetical protein [Gemmatimonadota bacterium]